MSSIVVVVFVFVVVVVVVFVVVTYSQLLRGRLRAPLKVRGIPLRRTSRHRALSRDLRERRGRGCPRRPTARGAHRRIFVGCASLRSHPETFPLVLAELGRPRPMAQVAARTAARGTSTPAVINVRILSLNEVDVVFFVHQLQQRLRVKAQSGGANSKLRATARYIPHPREELLRRRRKQRLQPTTLIILLKNNLPPLFE